MADNDVIELGALPPDTSHEEMRRILGLPGARCEYHIETDLETPTRDGHTLRADHYVPDVDGPSATVLVRSPYGRTFPQTHLLAAIYAASGYHVLFQSCRGTAGSSDLFQPMVRETEDAQDTVAWLREQPWFDGNLATAGASYLAFTQFALLQDPPPELRASVLVMGPYDFARVAMENGIFQLETWLGWSTLMADLREAIAAGGVEQAFGHKQLDYLSLPLGDAADTVMHGDAPWYRDWLRHPDLTKEFWDGYRATEALQRVRTPVLLVGGWQDVFVDQTVEAFRVLRERGVDAALTVGPWKHLELTSAAAPTVAQESLAWLDRHLYDKGPSRPPLRLYVTGADEWSEPAEFPTATSTWRVVFPATIGAVREGPGDDGASRFTFDPADPTPVYGGRRNDVAAGSVDNTELEKREDVLVFTGDRHDTDLEIVGVPVAEVRLTSDNPHGDLFVRLCDVDEHGGSTNFTDGIARLDPTVPAGTAQTVRVTLDPCAHRIRPGHRLRMQISGGAHPRFARNLGTGEPIETATALRPSTRTVHHAGTAVTLPVHGGE
ncbi:CocE/NonD family hydrolase [Pseudonocardia sp. KRD291]|uniref:CocE/NonD family hydrolase n=1 Tax=Pseudonocardia sp. KRD291 TaxID=2792007 RepID=UPI001C49F993|nr:CocE/NonD family hydrolase [Pseudonocardia sp. KRD291]MBW0101563.1 CocE/NonD family hydrolase [Pseudonocardia sp. KRD291]